jgi:hypothetical protein
MPQMPTNRNDRKAMQRYDADMRRWQRDKEQLEKSNRILRKQVRTATRRAEAAEARGMLKDIAQGVGIRDVGIAIHLYEEACAGKTEDELAKMDETEFFEGLRQTRPYLFGEVVVPATTGTTGGPPGSHTPLTTPAVSAIAGETGKVDAMKMSRAEWSAHQQRRGLRTYAPGTSR